MNDNEDKLKAQEYHQARVEIATQGARALLIINGGAAVALLGFMSSIWGQKDISPVIDSILGGLVFLSFGVLFAASNFFFRYWTSTSHQHNWPMRYRLFWCLEWLSIVISLVIFPWAILILSNGVKQVFLL